MKKEREKDIHTYAYVQIYYLQLKNNREKQCYKSLIHTTLII